LQVGIDLYVNETHRHADYLLPAATFYERDDVCLPLQEIQLTPFIQWTDAVVPPRGEAKPDWQIIDALARELGFTALAGALTRVLGTGRASRAAMRGASPVLRHMTPERLVDMLLRTGRDGDLYGLRRGGLSVAALRARPRGTVLADRIETGVLRRRVQHRDHRVHLDDARIAAELARLLASPEPPADRPLLMIGRREARSQNSWLHNTPKHRDPSRRQRAVLAKDDAIAVGIADGDLVRVASDAGAIVLPAELTDDLAPGTIAVPHGWGHRDGSWQVANAAGGANVNEITSADPASLERLSGMAHLNGVPVRIEAVSGPPA
jgi:formate dehydrogenase